MTTEPIRYFARQIYVENYPSCGSPQWCCLDSRGHYHVCRNEQSAVAEAMRRNAQSKEETTTMTPERKSRFWFEDNPEGELRDFIAQALADGLPIYSDELGYAAIPAGEIVDEAWQEVSEADAHALIEAQKAEV